MQLPGATLDIVSLVNPSSGIDGVETWVDRSQREAHDISAMLIWCCLCFSEERKKKGMRGAGVPVLFTLFMFGVWVWVKVELVHI